MTEADGTAVGEGYTVKAVNQQVSGWSIYTDGKTRVDGSYTDIIFIDFFGKTTNAGNQIVLTVIEKATGQTKGKKVFTVTQQMVTAMSASVDIRLGIMAEFSPVLLIMAGADNHPPVVTNVVVQQVEQQVEIVYDLEDTDGDLMTVSLQVSSDGGSSFDIEAKMLTGDVGERITSGKGKKILWQVVADIPDLYGTNFVFEVVADDNVKSLATSLDMYVGKLELRASTTVQQR